MPAICFRGLGGYMACAYTRGRTGGVSQSQAPPDAVTASGSGLDPDISPAYARIQLDRVAAARHLPVTEVRQLVQSQTHGRELGFLGQPTFDVLDLNLALDRLS